MQKSIKATAAAAVIAFLLSTNVSAQDMHTGSSLTTAFKNIPAIEKNISTVSSEDIGAKNQSVVARFSTTFPLATSLQWAEVKDALWVSFLNDGRKASACFTSKGKMMYVISDCGIEQLPASFSKTIKTDYPLYTLFSAKEIKAHDAVAYQVVIENQINFITLKYTNEGVEEVLRVNKTGK